MPCYALLLLQGYIVNVAIAVEFSIRLASTSIISSMTKLQEHGIYALNVKNIESKINNGDESWKFICEALDTQRLQASTIKYFSEVISLIYNFEYPI